MEYSTGIYYIVPFLMLVAGLMNTAESSLTKFKAYCDENSIQSKNIFFRKALDISNNIRNFRETFVLTHFLMIVTVGWMLKDISTFTEFSKFQFFQNLSEFMSVDILFIITTLIVIVPIFVFFSEILPNYLAGKNQAKFAVWSVIPVYGFHFLFFPLRIIIILFEKIFEITFKNFSDTSYLNSEEELRILIEESTKAGTIEENESMLIDNIFEFKETLTRQVMTPRKNIVAISDDWTEKEILDTLTTEGYSRYPVYSGSVDNILGILHTKDVVNLLINKKKLVLHEIMRPTIFIKEEDFIDDLLTLLQKKKIQMAVVNDDFGGTAGIITMEDILEEIVGEIHDEHDEVNKILEFVSENIYLADASAPVRDLNDLLPEMLPESDEYETIGGLIITETENIPEVNTEVIFSNYKFTILKRTKTRIEKIRIEYLVFDKKD
jgi:CBS domain containing-hemolysin-like protein